MNVSRTALPLKSERWIVFPVLIHERNIGHGGAGRKRRSRTRQRFATAALIGDQNVLEPIIAARLDHHVGDDAVTGLHLLEAVRIVYGIGHGHRGHESRDIVMSHGDLLRIDALQDDCAAELEVFSFGRTSGREKRETQYCKRAHKLWRATSTICPKHHSAISANYSASARDEAQPRDLCARGAPAP
jgi:hypothetical protein